MSTYEQRKFYVNGKVTRHARRRMEYEGILSQEGRYEETFHVDTATNTQKRIRSVDDLLAKTH